MNRYARGEVKNTLNLLCIYTVDSFIEFSFWVENVLYIYYRLGSVADSELHTHTHARTHARMHAHTRQHLTIRTERTKEGKGGQGPRTIFFYVDRIRNMTTIASSCAAQ